MRPKTSKTNRLRAKLRAGPYDGQTLTLTKVITRQQVIALARLVGCTTAYADLVVRGHGLSIVDRVDIP